MPCETLYSFGPFEKCDSRITSHGNIAVAQNHPTGATANIRSGSGRRGNHGGSGLSSIGGTIRVGELAPGSTIRHALKVNLWAHENLCSATAVGGGDQYVWPAYAADAYANTPNDRGPGSPDRSYGGRDPNLCMCSLLALPADFNLEALQTEPGRIIAQAFMDYGGYVVDDTTRDVYGLSVEWGPDGNVITEFEATWGYPIDTSNQASPWLQDLHLIFDNLHAVVNQSAGAVGGGLTGDTTNRRAPQAPPFD